MPDTQNREATDAEKAQRKRRDDAAQELDALRTAFNALDALSETARWRAMKWLDNALHAHDCTEEPPF